MDIKINYPKKNIQINYPQKNIALGVQRVPSGGIKQIYIGDIEPTDPNILIWIDTSIPPIIGTQLITADDLKFITSDNKAFLLKEEQKSQLLTSNNEYFITADDKEFILKEIINQMLLTNDNKEFIEANNKNFILKEEH